MAKPNWITLTPDTSVGNSTVQVSVSAYTARDQRTGTFNVYLTNATDTSVNVTVTQEGIGFVKAGNLCLCQSITDASVEISTVSGSPTLISCATAYDAFPSISQPLTGSTTSGTFKNTYAYLKVYSVLPGGDTSDSSRSPGTISFIDGSSTTEERETALKQFSGSAIYKIKTKFSDVSSLKSNNFYISVFRPLIREYDLDVKTCPYSTNTLLRDAWLIDGSSVDIDMFVFDNEQFIKYINKLGTSRASEFFDMFTIITKGTGTDFGVDGYWTPGWRFCSLNTRKDLFLYVKNNKINGTYYNAATTIAGTGIIGGTFTPVFGTYIYKTTDKRYEVWAIANQGNGSFKIGSVTTDSSLVPDGNTVTVTAVPDDGYYFVEWPDTQSTDPVRTVTVSKDVLLPATFSSTSSFSVSPTTINFSSAAADSSTIKVTADGEWSSK